MADVVKSNVLRKQGINLINPNELLRGMARHPELCIIVITFLITFVIKYGTSFKAKPVTLPPKPPQYMFSPTTFVLDSPRGSLIPLIEVLHSKEFVFVMYYAPWCYKSKAARAEFLKAANYFKGQVVFAAVNCWWPDGECRKRYKFLMFPVFMAYHTRLDGYRYFGHVRAEHMIRFLEDLIYPLKILNSKDEILDLVAKHEIVAIGYFNLTSPDDVGAYRQFYYASMRVQEKDPFQPVKFALVSQRSVAESINLTQFNEIILLRMTNSSLFYPYSNNVTCSNIIRWVLQNKGQELIKRILPEGIKSEVLAVEINRGPAFILFHNESPLFQIEHGLRVLKDVVVRYRECQLQPHFSNVWAYWSKSTQKHLHHHSTLKSFCQLRKQEERSEELEVACCICTILYNSSMSENVCNVCQHSSEMNKCHVSPHHLLSTMNHVPHFGQTCNSFVLNYSFSERMSFCCSQSKSFLQDMSPNSRTRPERKWLLNITGVDQRVHFYTGSAGFDRSIRHSKDGYIRSYLETLPRRLCDRLSLEKHVDMNPAFSQDAVSEQNSDLVQQSLVHLSHIGCSSNKSLNFYAIDSRNRWMFPDALGIESSISSVGPTAVLFDKKNEEYYVFKENFTYSNIVSFIMDYEQGHLKRHLQSGGFQQTSCDNPGQVCVTELESSSFMNTVMDESKDVVVLVYAHWCGFCQTLSHTFLTLAQYFSTSPHIVFARINGATNDLPWEYTFDSYPVILFFPAKHEPYDLFIWRRSRKADSIVFPVEEDKTLTSLIRFVLHHATYDTKLLLAADVCSAHCIQGNIARSAQQLQSLRLRQAKLQMKLTARPTDFPGAESHFSKLGLDFLVAQLQKVRSQIEVLEKLKSFLQQQRDAVRKEDLVHLLSAT